MVRHGPARRPVPRAAARRGRRPARSSSASCRRAAPWRRSATGPVKFGSAPGPVKFSAAGPVKFSRSSSRRFSVLRRRRRRPVRSSSGRRRLGQVSAVPRARGKRGI